MEVVEASPELDRERLWIQLLASGGDLHPPPRVAAGGAGAPGAVEGANREGVGAGDEAAEPVRRAAGPPPAAVELALKAPRGRRLARRPGSDKGRGGACVRGGTWNLNCASVTAEIASGYSIKRARGSRSPPLPRGSPPPRCWGAAATGLLASSPGVGPPGRFAA